MELIWNSSNFKKLATEIKSILKIKKMKHVKLGSLAGLHKNTICYILSGRVSTSHESIMRILIALKVDFNELFGKVYQIEYLQNQQKVSNKDLIESFVNNIKQRSISKSELFNQISRIWDN